MNQKKTIDYSIRTLWYSIVKMYNEIAKQYNATMVMAFTLLSIDPKNGSPATALGPKMGLEPTSLSRTLKNLETKEFIKRIKNKKDKRSNLIFLTEKGLKMRDISKKIVLSFDKKIEKNINEEELKIFYRVLNEIQKLTCFKENT